MIKEYIKNIVLGKRSSSKKYIEYLRSVGVKVGNDVTIYVPSKTLIDEQYPWMITIGNNVRITEGVKILTHDYAWSVLKKLKGGILGASGTVKIGNNVFIGMNTIISRNVIIGDNVVIGAGSVVTRNCESNGVYAGVPAKRIMSIDDFYNKREEKQLEEAKLLATEYYRRYRKKPDSEVFHEYFMLFENADSINKSAVFYNKIKLCENENDSVKYMKRHAPKFKNYEEFMRYCFDENYN